MQFDPALKELLFRKTGHPIGEGMSEETAAESVPVVALLRKGAAVPASLQVVARLGQVMTGRALLGQLVSLRAHPDILSLKASHVILPGGTDSVRDLGVPAIRHALPGGAALDGRGVLVAALDWGLDFAHAGFRDPAGRSRIQFLWDQRGGRTERSPGRYGYGRWFRREDLDLALSRPDPYSALGYDPSDADRAGLGAHGTHVLSIAGGSGVGRGLSTGVAPGADLGFVHLRGDDTAAADTLGDSVRLLEAVRFVLDRAADQPCVLNLSLGKHGGPHDGTTLVEQALDAVVQEAEGRAIVMSTGNYFGSRVHAEGQLAEGVPQELRVHVPPHARPEIEIWYPGVDRLQLEVIEPTGHRHGPVPPGTDHIARRDGLIVASLYHRSNDPNNGDHQIDVFLREEAGSGTWTLRLQPERVQDGRFHAWIERDDPRSQARFSAEQASVTTTTNTVCNGRFTIAVGAYASHQWPRTALPFSSTGPTRDGRHKPDVAAPGGSILGARSSRVLPDGRRTRDELTRMSGTSMAAPHVTGCLALLFQAAQPRRLPIVESRELLLSTALPPSLALDRELGRWGAGRVDIAAAVRKLLGAPRPEGLAEIDRIAGRIKTLQDSGALARLDVLDRSVRRQIKWPEVRPASHEAIREWNHVRAQLVGLLLEQVANDSGCTELRPEDRRKVCAQLLWWSRAWELDHHARAADETTAIQRLPHGRRDPAAGPTHQAAS